MTSSLERTLALRMLTAHPSEAAGALEALDNSAIAAVLSDVEGEPSARVLASLAPNRAAAVLERLELAAAREVLRRLRVDEAAELLRRMDVDTRDGLVDGLDAELAGQLRTMVEFPRGTAGALMDSSVLAMPLDVTAGEAIDQIRRTPEHVRYNLYIVDRERRLVGVLNLRELLLADRKEVLGALARQDVMAIDGHESAQAVLRHPAWREAHSLPVVDRRGVYLGAIRYRTWRRLAEGAARGRRQADPATAAALGELVSTGMAGLLGALVEVTGRPPSGDVDVTD